MKKILNRIKRRLAGTAAKPEVAVPFSGFVENRVFTPGIESMTDAELAELNAILPWRAFTVDSKGRRFGNLAWAGKRETPQAVPDRRVVLLDERVPLGNRHVLEIGCFEGIHTVALSQRAGQVTAIDVRVENVVKTIVRCSMFGTRPRVLLHNVEEGSLEAFACDVVHHVGVLYHLADPVRHLYELGRIARHAIMLDTHFAKPESATDTYTSCGQTWKYRRHPEGGPQDVFSGAFDHAKWLELSAIEKILGECGFRDLERVEERAERNGPRVLLIGKKRT